VVAAVTGAAVAVAGDSSSSDSSSSSSSSSRGSDSAGGATGSASEGFSPNGAGTIPSSNDGEQSWQEGRQGRESPPRSQDLSKQGPGRALAARLSLPGVPMAVPGGVPTGVLRGVPGALLPWGRRLAADGEPSACLPDGSPRIGGRYTWTC